MPFGLEHLFAHHVNDPRGFQPTVYNRKTQLEYFALSFCVFAIQHQSKMFLDLPKKQLDLLMPLDKEAKKFKADGAEPHSHVN